MTFPVEVLFKGEGYLAVNKPPGIPVIPGRSQLQGAQPPLKEQLERALGARLWVVHRLDRDTSGVLLFARNEKVHRELSMAFESGRISKRYLALVEGVLKEPLEIDVPLVPARKGKMRPARPDEAGKPARTQVAPLELFTGATWVEARPLTGRTHQIRVHLRWAGHPLLVDHQYGRAEPLRGEHGEVLLARTPLHAAELSIPKLEGLSARAIAAPLPQDLEQSLAHLRCSQR